MCFKKIKILFLHIGKKRKSQVVLTISFNQQNLLPMADINLQVGGGNKFGSFVLRDDTDNSGISATYSNLQFVNSNPGAAIFEPNTNAPDPESMVKATPISPGTGTVDITVHVDYTDPGDNQPKSENKTITKTFEVVGAPHGTHIELNFP